MKTKKINTTVYLTEEQKILLEELSKKSKMPVAFYIRQGVDLILKKHALDLPSQLSFALKQKYSKKNTTEK